MSRTLTTDQIRDFVSDARRDVGDTLAPLAGPNTAACVRTVDALLKRCDALDEVPEDYGFDYAVDDPNVGDEGDRDTYYAFKYAGDLPDGCSASYYILAPDDGHSEDAQITRFHCLVFDETGDQIADSDYTDYGDYFDTMAEVVAWFNTQLGGEVIKRLPPEVQNNPAES